MVDHAELQTALGPQIIRDIPPLQLILAARHDEESCVRPGDHPVKEARLDIGLQHDPLLARDGSVGRVGERLHPGEFLFQRAQCLLFPLRLIQNSVIGVEAGSSVLACLFGASLFGLQVLLLFQEQLFRRKLFVPFQLLFQLGELSSEQVYRFPAASKLLFCGVDLLLQRLQKRFKFFLSAGRLFRAPVGKGSGQLGDLSLQLHKARLCRRKFSLFAPPGVFRLLQRLLVCRDQRLQLRVPVDLFLCFAKLLSECLKLFPKALLFRRQFPYSLLGFRQTDLLFQMLPHLLELAVSPAVLFPRGSKLLFGRLQLFLNLSDLSGQICHGALRLCLRGKLQHHLPDLLRQTLGLRPEVGAVLFLLLQLRLLCGQFFLRFRKLCGKRLPAFIPFLFVPETALQFVQIRSAAPDLLRQNRRDLFGGLRSEQCPAPLLCLFLTGIEL